MDLQPPSGEKYELNVRKATTKSIELYKANQVVRYLVWLVACRMCCPRFGQFAWSGRAGKNAVKQAPEGRGASPEVVYEVSARERRGVVM